MGKDIYKTTRFLYLLEAAFEYFINLLLAGAYIAKVTSTLGMNDSLTGIVTGIISLASMFQIVALFLATKKPVKKWVTIFHTINQTFFALVYLVPFFNFSKTTKTVLFIFFLLVGYIISQIINPHKINWLMSTVDENKRGSFTATKERISLIGGMIFTFIVVCATGFVMLSLLEEISVLNFTPLFQDGLGQFFSDSLLFSLQASEIGVLITVLPEIKGNLKKGFVWWAALSGITFVAVLFFVVGTLGVFADTQLFPTYTAVTLAKFGLLQRMDALETAIWILCVVEKIALYFWVVTKNLKLLFPKVKSSILCLAQVIPVCGVLVFISGNLERFSFVSYTPVVAGMYIIPVILLPVSVLIYLKKVKKSEKSPQQL